jgi:hypothetical protein
MLPSRLISNDGTDRVASCSPGLTQVVCYPARIKLDVVKNLPGANLNHYLTVKVAFRPRRPLLMPSPDATVKSAQPELATVPNLLMVTNSA